MDFPERELHQRVSHILAIHYGSDFLELSLNHEVEKANDTIYIIGQVLMADGTCHDVVYCKSRFLLARVDGFGTTLIKPWEYESKVEYLMERDQMCREQLGRK